MYCYVSFNVVFIKKKKKLLNRSFLFLQYANWSFQKERKTKLNEQNLSDSPPSGQGKNFTIFMKHLKCSDFYRPRQIFVLGAAQKYKVDICINIFTV